MASTVLSLNEPPIGQQVEVTLGGDAYGRFESDLSEVGESASRSYERRIAQLDREFRALQMTHRKLSDKFSAPFAKNSDEPVNAAYGLFDEGKGGAAGALPPAYSEAKEAVADAGPSSVSASAKPAADASAATPPATLSPPVVERRSPGGVRLTAGAWAKGSADAKARPAVATAAASSVAKPAAPSETKTSSAVRAGGASGRPAPRASRRPGRIKALQRAAEAKGASTRQTFSDEEAEQLLQKVRGLLESSQDAFGNKSPVVSPGRRRRRRAGGKAQAQKMPRASKPSAITRPPGREKADRLDLLHLFNAELVRIRRSYPTEDRDVEQMVESVRADAVEKVQLKSSADDSAVLEDLEKRLRENSLKFGVPYRAIGKPPADKAQKAAATTSSGWIKMRETKKTKRAAALSGVREQQESVLREAHRALAYDKLSMDRRPQIGAGGSDKPRARKKASGSRSKQARTGGKKTTRPGSKKVARRNRRSNLSASALLRSSQNKSAGRGSKSANAISSVGKRALQKVAVTSRGTSKKNRPKRKAKKPAAPAPQAEAPPAQFSNDYKMAYGEFEAPAPTDEVQPRPILADEPAVTLGTGGRMPEAVPLAALDEQVKEAVLDKWDLLITAWKVMDTDRDRSITPDEFARGLRASGLGWLDRSTVDRIWASIDLNDDKCVNFREFKRSFSRWLRDDPVRAEADEVLRSAAPVSTQPALVVEGKRLSGRAGLLAATGDELTGDEFTGAELTGASGPALSGSDLRVEKKSSLGVTGLTTLRTALDGDAPIASNPGEAGGAGEAPIDLTTPKSEPPPRAMTDQSPAQALGGRKRASQNEDGSGMVDVSTNTYVVRSQLSGGRRSEGDIDYAEGADDQGSAGRDSFDSERRGFGIRSHGTSPEAWQPVSRAEAKLHSQSAIAPAGPSSRSLEDLENRVQGGGPQRRALDFIRANERVIALGMQSQ